MAGQRFQLARGLAVPRKGPSSQLGYSVASTITPAVSTQAIAVMLTPDTDVYVTIGQSATAATASGHLMLASNGPETWEVKGGYDQVAMIMHSVQGTMNVTEIVAPRDV